MHGNEILHGVFGHNEPKGGQVRGQLHQHRLQGSDADHDPRNQIVAPRRVERGTHVHALCDRLLLGRTLLHAGRHELLHAIEDARPLVVAVPTTTEVEIELVPVVLVACEADVVSEVQPVRAGILEGLPEEPTVQEPAVALDQFQIETDRIVCRGVEGVVVEEEAVIGAGTTITASTPIIDVTGPEEVVHKGRVPARSVVIPGVRPKKFPAGEYHLPCALIIGQRKESTDHKTSLTDVLREFAVQA